MINKVKSLLNKYRGVFCSNIDIDKENTWIISFSVDCKLSLGILVMELHELDAVCNIFSIDPTQIECLIFIKEEMIEVFIELLMENLVSYQDIREGMHKISNYDKLDQKSRFKYMKYVKYLRSRFKDGAEEASAEDLLNSRRFCGQCGKELYSKEDEIRTILEFNDPEKVCEVLDEIICEKDQ